MGALMIFAGGVLMVLRLSSALTLQIEYSGLTSQLVAQVHDRIDSLSATPFDSLLVETLERDITIGNQQIDYVETSSVTLVTPLLYELEVSMSPKLLDFGPSYSVRTYSSGAWQW